MRVQVVCRNLKEDRIIPRMARALQGALGWEALDHYEASRRPEVVYLSGYFEWQWAREIAPTGGRLSPAGTRARNDRGGGGPLVAAYFTHREEEPPGNAKQKLFDQVAGLVDVRIVTSKLYADLLARYGPVVTCSAPVDKRLFTTKHTKNTKGKLIVGVSGYCYRNGRKGERLVDKAVRSPVGKGVEWRASGRGWPVPTKAYRWAEMAGFYQGLDVLVCPSLVEGIPMPPLEALACGTAVVIPRGVGLLDELPSVQGIYRYPRGDAKGLVAALEEAMAERGTWDPEALREAVGKYSIEAWCADHARAFGELLTTKNTKSTKGEIASPAGTRARNDKLVGTASGPLGPSLSGRGCGLRVIGAGQLGSAPARGVRMEQRMKADKQMAVAGEGAKVRVDRANKAGGTASGRRLPAEREKKAGGGMAGIDEEKWEPSVAGKARKGKVKGPVEKGTGSTRGIYVVAFGDPARECAVRLIISAKKYMPDIPICLCAAKKLGVGEDLLVVQPDSDIGGRRAKLKAYELSPAEWKAVLYLDADTEVVAPIYRFFEWIEDGWEFVITKDPHLMDTMHSFERTNNKEELRKVEKALKTLHTLQWNGGVWAFGRNERVQRFFRSWQEEWEVHAQRDQGALARAMYAEPLKVWLLGNEWNTFKRYSKGVVTAGLMHYPGDARRWSGMIPGRIDSEAAWKAVERFMGIRKARQRIRSG